MTTYAWCSVMVSLLALVIAIVAVILSKRSADASVSSAAQAKRSADLSERSFHLGLKPLVVVTVAQKRQPYPVRPYERDVNALYLESKGLGIAFDIRAELQVGSDETILPFDLSLLALRPGDSHEVGTDTVTVPPTGKLEVWGKVAYRDAEKRPYGIEKARDGADWRCVKQPE